MFSSSRILKNVASSWFVLIVNIGTSLVLAPFVVHSLGNVYYGIWAIVGQFTGYLYLLDFGVRESVIRYTSKYAPRQQRDKLNRVLSTAIFIYIPIQIMTIIASALVAWGFPIWFDVGAQHVDTSRAVVFLVGLTIAQTFFFNVFTGILQGLHRFDVTNIFGVLTTLLKAGVTVVALGMGHGIVALAVIQLVFALISGIYTAIVARRMLSQCGMDFQLVWLEWKRFSALASKVGGYSLYVLINNIGLKIILVSDAILIGLFLPVSFVTYYAIAGSLVGYLRSLAIATAQIFNPLTSHYAALHDSVNVQHTLIRGCKLTTYISLPVIAAYSIMGSNFIELWMGKEYAVQAGGVLAILAIMYVFSSPHHVISGVLYGLSRHATLSLLRLVEAALNVALCVIFVQKYGIIGVALGVAIPHVVMTAIVLPLLVTRAVGLSMAQYYVSVYKGPAQSVVLFVAGAYLFKENYPAENLFVFFAQISVLLMVYILAGYRLVLTSDERSYVDQHMRSLIGKGPRPRQL
jgi:O-antigen/teichoic acid export membrane protein